MVVSLGTESGLSGDVKSVSHIPHLKTITNFYEQLRIGKPQSDDFSMMRIEDQPDTKKAQMPLFRSNFYRLVFLENSVVQWQLPNQRFDASDNCIYFAYPGKLESWLATQKNKGFLVCFTKTFAHIDSLNSTFDQHFPFFNFEAPSLLSLSDLEAAKIKIILKEMLKEINGEAVDCYEMLQHLLHQYLISAKRLYLKRMESVPSTRKSGAAVYNRFKHAVDDYFIELASGKSDTQASVSLMADRLHLNPSYLNSLIKQLTGKTASAYIHEKTTLEAKSYLMHTDLQVAEISYRLGFTNLSYFDRFFKRLTGETPLGFRKANG